MNPILPILYRLRVFAGRFPFLFYALHALRHPLGSPFAVQRDTEVVIEGFPRSANSFAVAAFQLAQGREIAIAHHLHVPAQIMRAIAWKIPALVIVRPPQDAVRSLVVRYPHIGVGGGLAAYATFHEALLPLQDGFTIATFDQVITDLGTVIARLNHRFGTGFIPFSHDDGNLSRLKEVLEARQAAAGGSVLAGYLPHPIREKAKGFMDFSAHKPALSRCQTLYTLYDGLASQNKPDI